MNIANKLWESKPANPAWLPDPMAKVWLRYQFTNPLNVIWWCLALSIISGTIIRYATEPVGLAYHLLLIMSTGACAWFWLLSRALFNDHKALQTKALWLVIAVIAIRSVDLFWPATNFTGAAGEGMRILSNVASVVCIASIACVWYESLGSLSRVRSKPERRFRILFPCLFSLLFIVAVFWLMGAEPESMAAQHQITILNICAFIGLVGSRLAVEYRLSTLKSHASSANDDQEDAVSSNQLAKKVMRAIHNETFITQTNLKVSELAKHLGEQEYKVTRCITQQLGYRNFNQLINHHRIERAMHMLQDPACQQLQVATIAFDCGYNSLGPFNKAFKQHTGMTPREFRNQIT